MPSRSRLRLLLPILGVLAMLGTSCLSPEQKMILKVDRFMEQQRWDDALGYLERYLQKHNQSLVGWRYRVLIRLEQGERATAAAEYTALNEALKRHEPEILREVVLGSGGRWLLSDYRALARCAPKGIADAAFFAEVLEPKGLSEGSFSKVAVPSDEVAAVIDALPGNLQPQESWAIVEKHSGHADRYVRERAVRSAGRHLATRQLDERGTGAALELIRTAGSDRAGELREAAVLASLTLPEGPARTEFAGDLVTGLSQAGDEHRAVSLFLLGPGGGGAGAWSPEQLRNWSGSSSPGLAVLSMGAQYAAEGRRGHGRLLGALTRQGSAGERLAAVVGFGNEVPGVSLRSVWTKLSLEEKRHWAPAFVRNGGVDRGTLAALAFGEQDAVLTQGVAAALALPGRGNDAAYEPALRAGLTASDPATRAATARAIVLRGASSLSSELEGLFEKGDERGMVETLQSLVQVGPNDLGGLVARGLAAEVPLVRERAVDAASASCRSDHRTLMMGLLTDEDPHVAVRAASALYLLVGSD